METFGAAISQVEEQLFTGRSAERSMFLDWLVLPAASPTILNVTGPGGVGKTTLLRAFGREARSLGRPVVMIDGYDLDPTPAAFLSAVSTAPMDPAPDVRRPPIASTDHVVAYLNAARPLLLIDTFEALGPLGHYLREEFLPRLAREVRVAIAGRYPLARAWGDAWSKLIRPIVLEAFSPEDGRLYLERRGIVDPGLVERILEATVGHPLALSLAADLALQLGGRDLATDPSWKLAAHGIVEQLLRDVADAELRAALEAASVVQQSDEPMLAALVGRPLAPATFSRLCGLSFVRPLEHGIMLHEDVRRILSNDLRWRDQGRYDTLRGRALGHYRTLMRDAPPDTLNRLVGERFFLWEDAFIKTMLYGDDEPQRLWVEMGRDQDHPDLIRIWEHWLATVVPTNPGLLADHHDLSADRATLKALLTCPGVRIVVARDHENRAVAFGLVLVVSQEALAGLPADCVIARVLRAYLAWAEIEQPPRTAAESTIRYITTVAHLNEQPMAEANAMIRWCVGFFASGGTFVASTMDSLYAQVLKAFALAEIPELTMHPWNDEHAYAILELELEREDADAWMESLMTGRPWPKRLRRSQIEHELAEILPSWRDDARLATSPLGGTLRDDAGRPIGTEPETLRQAIRATLDAARASATEDQALAYRAIELAYLDPAGTRVDAASQLAVSRRTFYRLLDRGIRDLALALHG